MSHATRAGDVLAGRYRLIDLLSESGAGRFWRAQDLVLERHVAVHVIASDDGRAEPLLDAAKQSACVLDPHLLRVLDAVRTEQVCFVVNEWGAGSSLDIMLATHGPLPPRTGAWMVAEVADAIAAAHAAGVTHGRLVPENVLVDTTGAVKIAGLAVDAALHGLPSVDAPHDVSDLAGLLEASLTGRWAGLSTSALPRVPTAQGRVLRPRQVRAGVPRVLDDLCDEVLNPRGARVRDVHNVGSARGIHTVLSDYVGDSTGLAEALAAANPERLEVVDLPSVPDIPARPHPDDVTPDRAEPARPDAPATPSVDTPLDPPVDTLDDEGVSDLDNELAPGRDDVTPAPDSGLPTQAGLPIFDDDNDEVSWLRRRDEPSPPPPPFEEPAVRPLFAPEPSDGEPTRRPRFPSPTHGPVPGARADGLWPLEPSRTTTGSGLIPAVEDIHDDGSVPGRSWLRAAFLVGVALALIIAVAVAVNLSRGKTALGDDPSGDTSGSASPSAGSTAAAYQPIRGVTAVDFDPQADPPRENPDEVGNAVDGNPDTAWETSTYTQQLGAGGLKQGVGLVLDLGRTVSVRRVQLTMVGQPTAVSIYLTAQSPTSTDGLTPAATVPEVSTKQAVTLPEAVSARFVTVWLTALPQVSGGYRGGVAEVVVDQ